MSADYICDLCGLHEYKIKEILSKRLGLEDTKYGVVKCVNCGLLRLYPIPDEIEFSSIYENYAVKKSRILVEQNREVIYKHKLQKLRKYCKGNRLLDIGAGLGTFVKCAIGENFDAIGIEYEEKQCQLAKELYNVDLINRKIEDIYKDLIHEEYDVINLHHVLEHVQSPMDILKVIKKLLAPGGIVLIEVPNQFSNIKKELWYRLFQKFKYPDNKLHHLTFFTIRTLKEYIKQNNFTILEINQFRPRTSNLPFLERLVKDSYRNVATKLNIGGNSFIELYLENNF